MPERRRDRFPLGVAPLVDESTTHRDQVKRRGWALRDGFAAHQNSVRDPNGGTVVVSELAAIIDAAAHIGRSNTRCRA
jgi:hypothetical protein